MKVLVVGSGGREHALVWKIAQSKLVEEVYCAPGNGGISSIAMCVPIDALDVDGVVNFSKEKEIDLVVVAAENPLAAGMVDKLEENGIRAFGPNKAATIIEGSKSFAKELMKKYGIPTAEYEVFDSSEKAISYLEEKNTYPIVVKADGLALGKGVIIARDFDEAKEAVKSMMEEKAFGEAGNKVVIEEFLTGQEVTVLAFTDGKTVKPMVSAQDHKRVFDNDEGPNTGGMGAFSPSRIYTPEVEKICMEKIFMPTIEAMNKEGRKFKGVLYFGLMVTKDGPKVVEYNARFGDPEAQVVLPRLQTDILEIFNAVIDEKLDEIDIKWSDSGCVCVIMASGGYPKEYEKGFEILGLDEAQKDANVVVFHAGTKKENEKYITAGGRVIGVTALEDSLDSAIKKAYEAVGKISFKNAHYRKDIGVK
ncbi:phosphoribosylamine--glycine ligase [Acetivibrio saccincola]|uniref:Phosphoribosylamine--glycine ligase n=1 Tax=Acetivibrio saccincola TaxID=1677857 RepID=A0A2K9EKT9_9FIRM|nr:phosphoribosylamine--glycine ligase [Acetivibrio saccincola]AUG57191.1 Phosphoribosylamine--glycine ligase [Acetivibrio saccincola]NLW26170.1 phosphoribosylamine--glycine ligase [Acetivibrio saccincola]PQQ68325.1 phosphoribosylamine--glycine ligase [Acetivibrio saccincola]HOA97718.1 phosphoribosylamine--glycine ligase [Acetivibrio saccincola]HQD27883.1 phosphoribosylamine--glycine ligase [Acetivibrio saccincola]